jgi:hypothetical protein
MIDKIFDKDVEEYLLAAGVSKLEIQKIKYKTYKQAVKKRLEDVIDLINNNDFDEKSIKKYTENSYGGDYVGNENDFISFAFIDDSTNRDGIDIVRAFNYLKALKDDIENTLEEK